MKAIGLFLMIFLGMLTFFLVATGEVKRWFFPPQELETMIRLPPEESSTESNRFKVEFWDVKKARLRFIISAELSQETLQSTDAIDKLQEITLKNGIIELPYPAKTGGPGSRKGDETSLQKLAIEFKSAVYRKGDGLTSGKMPLVVRLRDGKGTTNEGTEFYFEELLFVQNNENRDRFELSSEKPARIVRKPALEVYSPSGLEGRIDDAGNFEHLAFHPPVYTYLEPRFLGLFAEGPGNGSGALDEAAGPRRPTPVGTKSSREESDRRIVVSCEGPLEIDFDVPSLRGDRADHPGPDGDKSEIRRTRVTFTRNVSIYEVETVSEKGPPPPPQRNSFECETFQLEIDDSTMRPVPSYALATTRGGRVVAHFGAGDGSFALKGDRLEWVRLRLSDGAVVPDWRSEAVLSGAPELVGKNVRLRARRAILKLEEDRIVLEQVKGVLLRRPDKKTKESGRGTTARKKPGEQGQEGEMVEEVSRLERLDFLADEVEIFFDEAVDGDGRKVLSHFVARSSEPRGVVIERHVPGVEGDTLGFRATGRTLRYRQRDKLLTLQGSAREVPRLSRGTSWIEAEKIHLISDGSHAWFEERVKAHFDQPERADGKANGRNDAGIRRDGEVPRKETETAKKEPRSGPRVFEIESDFLDVFFKEGELHSLEARGNPGDLVSVTTFGDARYSFRAPEVHLDIAGQVARLIGDGPEVEERRLAATEFEGGEVRAGQIRFERRDWKCYLTDTVEVRLGPTRQRSAPGLQIHSKEADLQFYEGFRGKRRGDRPGPLGQLDLIENLRAVSGPGGSLTVRGKNFIMRGEEARWEGDKQELRFFGPGTQVIELLHAELHGPIRAREIVYEKEKNLVTLQGKVTGELEQPPQTREKPSQEKPSAGAGLESGKGGRPLKWQFETSVLEVEIGEAKEGGGMELRQLRARDKVLLLDPQNGLKLRGDDLIYDHGERKVRVFAEDGRLQTLVRYHTAVVGSRSPTMSPRAPEVAEAVDKIHAQEIRVFLQERARPARRPAAGDQRIVVEFAREVNASFLVSGKEIASLGRDEDDFWKLEAETLTLYIDRTARSGDPRLLQAIASGDVRFSSSTAHAGAERAEYDEREKRLRLVGSPASFTMKRDGKGTRTFSEKHDEIDFYKKGDSIRILYRGRVRKGEQLVK